LWWIGNTLYQSPLFTPAPITEVVVSFDPLNNLNAGGVFFSDTAPPYFLAGPQVPISMTFTDSQYPGAPASAPPGPGEHFYLDIKWADGVFLPGAGPDFLIQMYEVQPPTPTPEPSSTWIPACVVGLGYVGRRIAVRKRGGVVRSS
jgi:hypothetical protein